MVWRGGVEVEVESGEGEGGQEGLGLPQGRPRHDVMVPLPAAPVPVVVHHRCRTQDTITSTPRTEITFTIHQDININPYLNSVVHNPSRTRHNPVLAILTHYINIS